ncbi:hypothetical protein [Mycobacterium sp.]|uniref:hypothetical protein n=1 Tax=Mycobacterium sp. TaxID=1785 RepID=UPI0031D0BC5C
MRTSRTAAAAAVATVLLGLSAAGCHSRSTSSPAAPTDTGHDSASAAAPEQPSTYTGLLIRAQDIDAPVTFTASPPIQDPNGQQGAATTFSDEDGSHVIRDTILILPDPAAAANALDAAKDSPPGSVTAAPVPVQVGAGGTMTSGDLPDGSKGFTVLLFTQGRAFATLEFDGPKGVPAPKDFVVDVGRKQDAAIKDGLPA